MNSVKYSSTAHPLSYFLSYDKLSPNHKAYATQFTLVKEPTSYSQAIKDPNWREAMQHEITILQNNGTWSLVPLPSHK